MNIHQLDEEIQKAKERSPKTHNKIAELTLPFYMFHRIMFEGSAKLQEERYQISNSELDVLCCLLMTWSDTHTLSPTKIYDKLLFTSGGITKVLKKLEDKKYVIRIDNQYDKRSKLVQLTAKGKDISEKALKDVLDYEEKCFSGLDEEEKKTFKSLFVKMLKNL